MKSIYGKNVLFVGQVFYDYHLKIANELKRQGANVTFISNKFHGDGTVSRLDFIGQLRKLVMPFSKRIFANEILRNINGKKFDYFFCIGGFSITPYLISKVRINNPQIKTIAYFWDSFKVWDYSNLIHLFDYVYSFDPEDSANFKNVKYLPLFYTREYIPNSLVEKDIDLLYVGSVSMLSKNRFEILEKVSHYANKNNLKTFFWLYYAESSRGILGKIQTFIKRIMVPEFKEYFKLVNNKEVFFLRKETLKQNDIINLMQRTKCVLDIPIPNQFGLTIRTIETLASKNRLLTTNNQIGVEPFYDKEYIKIIDENDLVLDLEFIRKDNKGGVDISQLELKNWILSIFN